MKQAITSCVGPISKLWVGECTRHQIILLWHPSSGVVVGMTYGCNFTFPSIHQSAFRPTILMSLLHVSFLLLTQYIQQATVFFVHSYSHHMPIPFHIPSNFSKMIDLWPMAHPLSYTIDEVCYCFQFIIFWSVPFNHSFRTRHQYPHSCLS